MQHVFPGYDGDTGGEIEHCEMAVRALERAGVSMVIFEDKTGLKRNSMLGNDVPQQQDSVEHFSEKIAAARSAAMTRDFMVAARCESLVLDAGLDDAMARCLGIDEILALVPGNLGRSERSSPSDGTAH